jgi:hypothetical protein
MGLPDNKKGLDGRKIFKPFFVVSLQTVEKERKKGEALTVRCLGACTIILRIPFSNA